jgi:hypothetical protein
LHIPLLKGKDRVSKYREEIHKESPIIQDKEGTAAWLHELPAIFREEIVDERIRGFLQSRKCLTSDELRAHFGGNAASYFRAVNTSEFAAKLIIDGKQVNHNPRNMRSILQFEGKDTYETYKRYYSPFVPVIAQLEAGGIQVKDSLQADPYARG